MPPPRFKKIPFAPWGLSPGRIVIPREAGSAYQSIDPQVGLPLWIRYNIVSQYWEYTLDNVNFYRLKENPYVPYDIYFKNIGTASPTTFPAIGEARLFVKNVAGQPKAIIQWSDGSESVIASGPLALTWPSGTTSFWRLDEATGSARVDQLGVNNLNNIASCTQVAGKVGNATGFAIASAQYLERASTTTLAMFGVSFEFTGWIYLTSNSVAYTFLGKGNAAALREYQFRYDGSGTFEWRISFDGTTWASTTSYSLTPTINTWYHFDIYYDIIAGQSGLALNRGGFITTSPGIGGLVGGGQNFRIGGFAGSSTLDGRVDATGLWYNKILSEAERDLTFNGSNGAEL